jgi:F-type H+-transporting ATPase subunit beta
MVDAVKIGVIGQVRGPVVDIACLRLPSLRQALFTQIDGQRFWSEVHQHLDELRARAIALHDTSGLMRGLPVFDSYGPLRVPVDPGYLGRLLDIFGAPLDGGAPMSTGALRDIIARPHANARLTPHGVQSAFPREVRGPLG